MGCWACSQVTRWPSEGFTMGALAPVQPISPAGWRTEDGEIRMLTMNRDRGTLLAALIALGAWTAAVLTPAVAEADLVATRWLQQFASPALDVAFSIFTIAGNAEVGAVLAGLIGVTLFRAGRARLAVALWAVFIGGTGMEWIAKHWLPHPGVPESLQRPGVNFLHYIVRTPYSYLSGHAFRTLLLAGAALWVWAPSHRSQPVLAGMVRGAGA